MTDKGEEKDCTAQQRREKKHAAFLITPVPPADRLAHLLRWWIAWVEIIIYTKSQIIHI
jgi:hypothetical protein